MYPPLNPSRSYFDVRIKDHKQIHLCTCMQYLKISLLYSLCKKIENGSFSETRKIQRLSSSVLSWTLHPYLLHQLLVEVNGIEPMTSCLQSTRSPN